MKLNVKRWQTLLTKAGFNVGEVDGDFGAKTKAQTIAFKKRVFKNPKLWDENVGPRTLTAMYAYLAKRAVRKITPKRGTFIIAAGHGDSDPGAVALGRREATEAVLITDALEKILKNAGYKVYKVPNRYDLQDQIPWVNRRFKNGIAIEIHKNSGPKAASGVEVFFLASNPHRAARASIISGELSKATGLDNRGSKPDTSTRHGRLGWIRQLHVESYLVEAGFISSVKDNNISHKAYAQGIANGLIKLVK